MTLTNNLATSIANPLPSNQPVTFAEAKGPRARALFPRYDGLFSLVILVCGLLTVAIGTFQILSSHSLVPLWDEWTELDALAKAPNHQLPLSWLWAQHSEHRIVFYRLLLLSDIHLFHGRHWIEFVAMLAVQLLFLIVLALLLRSPGFSKTLWRSLVGLAAFALFCPTQWENFGWAFQISFLLPAFFLACALTALLKYEKSLRNNHPRWVYLGISISCAFAATFANANGVVLWPLLLLVGIAIVPRFEVAASFIGFGIASISLYLYHYVSPGYHSSPVSSLRHPVQVLAYVAGFLGVVFPAWVRNRNAIAVSSGSIGLGIAAILAVYALTRPKRNPMHTALLALMGFSVSTAFLAALGRLKFGLEQAFSSRYQTFNLLFWFALGSLLLLILDESSPSLRSLMLAATAAIMLIALVVFPLGLKASRTRTMQAEAAATALLSGVPDNEALAVLYDEPDLLLRDTEYFREQHIFMFSDERNSQIGQPISARFIIDPHAECSGQVTSSKQLRSEDLYFGGDAHSLRISGWATAEPSRAPMNRLLFASVNRIAGYGAPVAGSLSAKHSEIVRNKDSREWLGFAQVSRVDGPIEVYGLAQAPNVLCRLGEVESH